MRFKVSEVLGRPNTEEELEDGPTYEPFDEEGEGAGAVKAKADAEAAGAAEADRLKDREDALRRFGLLPTPEPTPAPVNPTPDLCPWVCEVLNTKEAAVRIHELTRNGYELMERTFLNCEGYGRIGILARKRPRSSAPDLLIRILLAIKGWRNETEMPPIEEMLREIEVTAREYWG